MTPAFFRTSSTLLRLPTCCSRFEKINIMSSRTSNYNWRITGDNITTISVEILRRIFLYELHPHEHEKGLVWREHGLISDYSRQSRRHEGQYCLLTSNILPSHLRSRFTRTSLVSCMSPTQCLCTGYAIPYKNVRCHAFPEPAWWAHPNIYICSELMMWTFHIFSISYFETIFLSVCWVWCIFSACRSQSGSAIRN